MSLYNNNQIKEELFSLFKGIKDDIPNDKLPLNKKNIQNISTLDSITLITYIKESILILISQKISEAKTQNNNDITFDTKESDEYLNLKNEYNQLENQLKKAESDTRFYLQKFLKSEIKKKVLEMKLNAYMGLEEEYEELKEKVKYDGGKFLDNERKENEIIILRKENSSLKKEITKLERNIKIKDNKIIEHKQLINEMKYKIESLNNKISSLNNFIDNNNFKKTLIQEKNNSMVDLGLKHKNSEFFLTKLEYFNKIHPKNINNTNFTQKMNSIYPQTFKIRKKIIFNPQRNDSFNRNTSTNNISINSTNRKLLSTIYNKLNKNNKRNSKIPFGTLMKMKGSHYKSISLNKELIRTKDDVMNKSNNKKKVFKNILFSKPLSFSPKSC